MNFRLKWEPENLAPLDAISTQLASYVANKSGVSLLANGTALFVVASNNNEAVARKAMEQAKHLTDFQVVKLREGGYLVVFHEAVASFVGDREFSVRREEILSRLGDLLLPGENLVAQGNFNREHYLIGLYGRGKMYRDAYDFSFAKRIPGGRDIQDPSPGSSDQSNSN